MNISTTRLIPLFVNVIHRVGYMLYQAWGGRKLRENRREAIDTFHLSFVSYLMYSEQGKEGALEKGMNEK